MRTFNSTPQRHCVEVEIFDDDTVESDETFTLSLTTNDPAMLHGGFTTVTIIDNDGMPCSFHDGLYVLQEHHFSCLWDTVYREIFVLKIVRVTIIRADNFFLTALIEANFLTTLTLLCLLFFH